VTYQSRSNRPDRAISPVHPCGDIGADAAYRGQQSPPGGALDRQTLAVGVMIRCLELRREVRITIGERGDFGLEFDDVRRCRSPRPGLLRKRLLKLLDAPSERGAFLLRAGLDVADHPGLLGGDRCLDRELGTKLAHILRSRRTARVDPLALAGELG
jgi:hypothetical protein